MWPSSASMAAALDSSPHWRTRRWTGAFAEYNLSSPVVVCHSSKTNLCTQRSSQRKPSDLQRTLVEICSDRWDVARNAKLGKKAAKRAAAAAAAAAAELPGKAKREEEDEEGEAYERAPRRRLREAEEGERAAALPVKVNGELLYGGSANGAGVPQVAHPTKLFFI